MGMYDSVIVPCPVCGIEQDFQTKSGPCSLESYTLADAPADALMDVNRHSPAHCPCGVRYFVELSRRIVGTSAVWDEEDPR